MSEETRMIMQAISELHEGMNNSVNELRGEISGLCEETHSSIAELRQEMNQKFDEVNARLDHQLSKLVKLEEEQYIIKNMKRNA